MASVISRPLSTAGTEQTSANEPTTLEHAAFETQTPLEPVVSVML